MPPVRWLARLRLVVREAVERLPPSAVASVPAVPAVLAAVRQWPVRLAVVRQRAARGVRAPAEVSELQSVLAAG